MRLAQMVIWNCLEVHLQKRSFHSNPWFRQHYQLQRNAKLLQWNPSLVFTVTLRSGLLSHFHLEDLPCGVSCRTQQSQSAWPKLRCVPVLSCFLRAQLRSASDAVPITAHFRKNLGTVQRIKNTRAMVGRVGNKSWCGTVGAVRGNNAVPLKVTSRDKEQCVLKYICVSKMDWLGWETKKPKQTVSKA